MASSSSSASTSTSSSTSLCASCQDELSFPSSDDPTTRIIDDVKLACGCHFHWECIIESGTKGVCPSCEKNALNPSSGQFLVDVLNEGGLTRNFDLGKELEESSFLEEHPLDRRNGLFLQFVAQSELEEVERLLSQDDGLGRQDVNYQDDKGVTGLHIAASNDDTDAIELLLKYGANKDVRSADGATPLDCARVTGSQGAALLLQ